MSIKRISYKIRSAYVKETPVGNAKRRVFVLGGSSGAKALRGAWYIMAATERGPDLLRDCLYSPRGRMRVSVYRDGNSYLTRTESLRDARVLRAN
jgi:hypothetical protein